MRAPPRLSEVWQLSQALPRPVIYSVPMRTMLAFALAAGMTACAAFEPSPECEPAKAGELNIDCRAAVSAAERQLRADHPAITRIQFLHGSYQPQQRIVGWLGAYVVLTYSNGSREAVQFGSVRGKRSVATPGPY